jgi:hypothetical protein
MVTALLIIIGSQRPAAPPQVLPHCAIDLTDYTSL